MATQALDTRLTRAEVEKVIEDLSPAEWAKAESIARGYAWGGTGLTAEDLLQEAFVKFLSEERAWPRGVHPLVVLRVTMHSIANNAFEKARAGPLDPFAKVDADADASTEPGRVLPDPTDGSTPVEPLAIKQQLRQAEQAVVGDEDLELLLCAWAEGLRGNAAMDELQWDEKKHDAVRKRLTRKLTEIQEQWRLG